MSELKNYAFELGFDDFGVADATKGTPSADHFQDAIDEGRHGPLDYLERTKEERADVQKLMPGAKSVIVVVKNYYAGDHADFVSIDELKKKAKVSRYAWGGDYHHWFRKRLRKLRERILSENKDARVHIFNDSGPVLERAWAQRAGLGFIGKSAMFIHRRYGTWIFLGGLVTDVEFEANEPFAKSLCGSCVKCLEACPTGALIEPRKIDARRCLTTWNVERPFGEGATQKGLLGHRWAVGCDVCQEVCPWNKFEQVTQESRFLPREGHIAFDEVPQGDLRGTPLARPRSEGIRVALERALCRNGQNKSDQEFD